MKKIIFRICLLTSLCLAFGQPVLAQTAPDIAPMPPDTSVPLLGNEHFYSVTVKTSGMLIVNSKLVLSNNTNKPKSDYKFTDLGSVKGEITGYQQIKGRRCERPDYEAKKCLQFGDPDYSAYSYYGEYDEPTKYEPLDLKIENGELSIKLPSPVASYRSTAVVLSYYLAGQSKNGLFGQKLFQFETIKDQSLIKEARVAVDTDADLYIRGERSRISTSSGRELLLATDSSSISSKSFDNAVYSIGSYGQWMNKTGKDIIPGESLKVTGRYSTTWLGFYWKLVLILLIIIALIIFGFWWLLRKPSKKISESSGLGNESRLVKSQNSEDALSNLSFREVATAKNFLTSFLIAASAILVFVGGVYILRFISYSVEYYYNSIVYLTGVVLALLLVGAVLGYPIYLGVRKGINSALFSILSYIAAIIVAVIIAVILTSAFSSSSSGSSSASIPPRDIIY